MSVRHNIFFITFFFIIKLDICNNSIYNSVIIVTSYFYLSFTNIRKTIVDMTFGNSQRNFATKMQL